MAFYAPVLYLIVIPRMSTVKQSNIMMTNHAPLLGYLQSRTRTPFQQGLLVLEYCLLFSDINQLAINVSLAIDFLT